MAVNVRWLTDLSGEVEPLVINPLEICLYILFIIKITTFPMTNITRSSGKHCQRPSLVFV